MDNQLKIADHYRLGKESMKKDELGGKVMTEFVTHRTKMYAYKKKEHKGPEEYLQGYKKWVAETLKIEDYKKCLFDGKTVYREEMLFIRITMFLW